MDEFESEERPFACMTSHCLSPQALLLLSLPVPRRVAEFSIDARELLFGSLSASDRLPKTEDARGAMPGELSRLFSSVRMLVDLTEPR